MEEIRKQNWLRSACAMLAALLVSMVILNIARSEALSDANNRINAMYQKALYETCELTEGISINYRKLLVAADAAQMQTLLGEISRQAQGASGNLALLPLGEETISATLKYINQAEDFAKTLSVKLASGDGASQEDYKAMQALSESAAAFSFAMNGLLERYERGELVFDAGDFTATGRESLHPLTGDADSYPVLLYDGPFSDGVTGGSFAMLENAQEADAVQAEAVLRAFIPVDEIRYLGQSSPGVDCHEFSLRSGKYTLSAGVTVRGGQLLYLLPENAEPQTRISEAELCAIARDFLRARGYGEMEMSYYSSYNGVITINFAAMQDGVILYPDLVKIQLSMEDGAVIGLDARGYLKNHSLRTIPEPALDEAAALAAVGERLAARSARLCVIPQNRSEYLCYEITASDGGDEFLVYIDAQTGTERELMQVLSKENGTLVM